MSCHLSWKNHRGFSSVPSQLAQREIGYVLVGWLMRWLVGWWMCLLVTVSWWITWSCNSSGKTDVMETKVRYNLQP